MNVNGHVKMDEWAAAIRKLPASPQLTSRNGQQRNRKGRSTDSAAPKFAQSHDYWVHFQSFQVTSTIW